MKHLFVLLMLFSFANLQAKDIYVSPNGDDNNSGSINSPFRTIQRGVNELTEGGSCYIREGVYREKVDIPYDYVTLEAYNNEKVVISGTELVSGWERYKGEIYRVKVTGLAPDFTQLLDGGVAQKMARYPDHLSDNMYFSEDDADGYAWINVKENGEVIFDEPLPFDKDELKGAYFKAVCAKACENNSGRVAINKGNRLVCDEITSIWRQSSNGLKSFKSIGRGKGFVYHLSALSREGEWYYEDDYLYYWNYGGGKPENGSIEVQKHNYTIVADSKRGFAMKGVDVKGSAIKINNCVEVKINNCTFKDIQGWCYSTGYGGTTTEMGGVYINGVDVDIRNSYFTRSWGSLLTLDKCDGVRVDNSIFENNGWVGLFTSCIATTSDNVTVTNSTFGDTGRFHIRTDGHHKLVVKWCDFYDCMKMGQDAGSIQLTNTQVLPNAMDMMGSEFAYNTFHDMDTLPGWTTTHQFVAALYFEGAENYTVHHNLFYNIVTDKKDGTFLYLGPRYSKIRNCFFYNNTIWNIDFRIKIWNYEKDGHYGGISNMIMSNNIFTSDMINFYGEPISLEDGITFNNTLEAPLNNASKIFKDAANGDFTLAKDSPAIDAGCRVLGVTDGHTGDAPDIGCYEYGVEPWRCGATLKRR